MKSHPEWCEINGCLRKLGFLLASEAVSRAEPDEYMDVLGRATQDAEAEFTCQ